MEAGVAQEVSLKRVENYLKLSRGVGYLYLKPLQRVPSVVQLGEIVA